MAKKKSKKKSRRQLGSTSCPTETLFLQRGFDAVKSGDRKCSALGKRSLDRAADAMKRGDCRGALQLYRAAMRGCPIV